MTSLDKKFHYLTLSALYVLAIGIFTSVSFSALSHILLIISGAYFSFKFFKEKEFEMSGSLIALFVLSLVIILSVIFNWNEIDRPLKKLLKVKYFLIAGLGTISCLYLQRDFLNEKHKKRLLNLFLLATTIATLSGLYGLWSGFNPIKYKAACHESRACGLYGMYMTYGYGISLFMVLMATGLKFKRVIFRYTTPWFFYSCFLINFLGLYFSYARGAWLGFLLAIPFLFFKEHKRKFLVISLASLVSLGLSISFIPQAKDMFFNRATSNNKRIAFYKTALRAWQEKPLLGWGYRNFEPNVVEIKKRHGIEYPEVGGHAHNNFLEHLASTGLIGVGSLALFLLLWLKESYRNEYTFAFLVSFLISGLFQYTFGDGENLFLIFLVYMYFTSLSDEDDYLQTYALC